MSPLKTWIALGAAGLTLAGCATGPKQGFGQVAGGVTGALIGSQFGSGSGKLAATALGAVVGTMIGGEIGRQLDEADQRALYDAQYKALEYGNPGTPVAWNNPNSGHRGEIVPRNASRAPYVSTLDLHYGIQVPVFVTNVELNFDVLNLLNLLNEDWGTVRYANLNAVAPVEYRGVDPATGKPVYYLRGFAKGTTSKFVTNDLASRWQAKVGARISF